MGLNWLNKRENGEFDLNNFIQTIVNFIIDTSIIVISEIDVAGILQEKLFTMHSDENSKIRQYVKQKTIKDQKSINYQQLRLRRSVVRNNTNNKKHNKLAPLNENQTYFSIESSQTNQENISLNINVDGRTN